MKRLFTITIILISLTVSMVPIASSYPMVIDNVQSIAWSPDMKKIAFSEKNSIHIISTSSWDESKNLVGGSDTVYSVDWSSDGDFLASCSYDGYIRVWFTFNWTYRTIIKLKNMEFSAIAISPACDKIAVASTAGPIFVLNATTLKQESVYNNHTKYVNFVSWSPDGTRLASGADDKTFRVWNVTAGTMETNISINANYILAVSWSPNGKYLATGSSDGVVRIWDTQTWENPYIFFAHDNWVWECSWSPDSNMLVTCSADGSVKLWDVGNETLKSTLNTDHSQVLAVKWSPDGTYIASGGKNSRISIWDSKTGALLVSYPDRSVPWGYHMVFLMAIIAVFIVFFPYGYYRTKKSQSGMGMKLYPKATANIFYFIGITLIMAPIFSWVMFYSMYGLMPWTDLMLYTLMIPIMLVLSAVYLGLFTPTSLIIFERGVGTSSFMYELMMQRKNRIVLFTDISHLWPKYTYDVKTGSVEINGITILTSNGQRYNMDIRNPGGNIWNSEEAMMVQKAMHYKWDFVKRETPIVEKDELQRVIRSSRISPKKYKHSLYAVSLILSTLCFYPYVNLFYGNDFMLSIFSFSTLAILVFIIIMGLFSLYNIFLGRYAVYTILRETDKKTGSTVIADAEKAAMLQPLPQ